MYVRMGGGSKEWEDILVADLALTLGFTLAVSGGIGGIGSYFFIFLLPISFIAVSLSFVLHELMHKFVAQRFGAIAGFRRSDSGIMITLITSLFGFLIGLPGATMIYSSRFTRQEEGLVSLAGPMTNFVVFAVFFTLGTLLFPHFSSNVINIFDPTTFLSSPYLQNILDFVVFISIYLAFFNMLPIYPLDGSKVFAWNKPVYFTVMAAIFILLTLILPISSIIFGLVFILIIALIMSMIYKNILF